MLGIVVVSLVIRVLLVLRGAHEWLGERVEVATPVNSWSRCKLLDTRLACVLTLYTLPYSEGGRGTCGGGALTI